MKTILAFALLAVFAFTVAGCGVTKKIAVQVKTTARPIGNPGTRKIVRSLTVDGITTVTIPNVKTGTRVACEDWGGQGVGVPPRGEAVSSVVLRFAIPGKNSPPADQMSLKHLLDGSITVTCTPSKRRHF